VFGGISDLAMTPYPEKKQQFTVLEIMTILEQLCQDMHTEQAKMIINGGQVMWANNADDQFLPGEHLM
jgi:hypothetical protein